MKQKINVPGFVSKLWTLVESPSTNDVICWSSKGQNFRVVDEQKFTTEILPRYFKHNNMSSFIRQLNMYGFRKVVSVDGGLIKQEKDGGIEFHHPCFEQGKEDMLENIKRKVSSVRTEATKISQEEMHKVLMDVHQVKGKQDDMDSKLETMKRENKALWKELASLRNKHSQQQKMIGKVIQFIASLVNENCVVGIKRKRPIMMSEEAPLAKHSHPYVLRADEQSGTSYSDSNGATLSSSVVITDITNISEPIKSGELIQAFSEKEKVKRGGLSGKVTTEACDSGSGTEDQAAPSSPISASVSPPQTKQLNTDATVASTEASAAEFPDNFIESILDEAGDEVALQSDSIGDRDEVLDFLGSVDISLGNLHTQLSGNQFNIRPELIDELFNPGISAKDMNIISPSSPSIGLMSEPFENSDNAETDEIDSSNGKYVVQCTHNPLLTLLDELCCSLEPEVAGPAEPSFLSLEEEPSVPFKDSTTDLRVEYSPNNQTTDIHELHEENNKGPVNTPNPSFSEDVLYMLNKDTL
ncbi:heat shock factor protein 3-like isoform X1 [Acipenser oxyrinchus oxyrinchus]|uniref:Heat shock factor protein 3-like isoform X1 n=1 Tax=Acipenser oxyrinchus oxyrinchus TaxID=40147 RepID=A0AAD8D6E1_ACIOX|nr:heat shock factor protein 3-like isoform X1 [Acipenser oxyrinchus oxyrinchus]